MASDELIELWTGSPDGAQRTEFEILRQIGSCYVARSPSDTAALIVPLPDGDLPRGRVLGCVRVRYENPLRFLVEGKAWSQPAAVIDCLDIKVVRTFCAVVRDVLERLQGTEISAKRVAEAVSAWDDLLRRRSKLTDSSELGLWGELFLLSMARNRDAMVAAWRGPDGYTMDFLGGGIALECKTSSRRHQHRISHRQGSFDGEDVQPCLVSVWACEDPTGGKTLSEMVDQLMASVVDEAALLRKLIKVGYREEHRPEYVRRFACPARPRFVRFEQVPRIRAMDEGIANIRYDVDFSCLSGLGDDEIVRLFERLTRSEGT